MSAAGPGVSLNWLLDGIASVPANDARIEDLTLDSRAVRAGSLFFALNGRERHGLEFAADAAARGASVLLWELDEKERGPSESSGGMFAAAIPDLRQLLGRIADRFFGRPSAHLRIVGITGTNGKTTCAYLLAQCLERRGLISGYMGTLGWGRIGAFTALAHTTPDVISVHRQLASLRSAGVRDVAMEVSSHALDQGRVDCVRFHTAAFTNLSRDHLDYHASMAAYAAAKARLFAMPDVRHLVINIGDACGRDFASSHTGRIPLIAVWVNDAAPSWRAERTLFVAAIGVPLNRAGADCAALQGITLEVRGSLGSARIATRLLGRFNAENSIVVLGCLLALGVDLAEAANALELCTAPPGRMEVVEVDDPLPQGEAARSVGVHPLAVIDYAHTPDALAKVLNALREHCRGALWCVFGCGGDRDAGKRPLMGAVVDDLADRIIVTDDNPRSESPEAITREIIAGITAHSARVIHDRGSAIATALKEAAAGDVVLIAGKGHEDYQIYGTARRSFSDRREVQRHLQAAAWAARGASA